MSTVNPNHAAFLLQIRFRQMVRQVNLAVKAFKWAFRNKPLTDDERFALRLARMHIREGRPELAAEDFAWLERRLSS